MKITNQVKGRACLKMPDSKGTNVVPQSGQTRVMVVESMTSAISRQTTLLGTLKRIGLTHPVFVKRLLNATERGHPCQLRAQTALLQRHIIESRPDRLDISDRGVSWVLLMVLTLMDDKS